MTRLPATPVKSRLMRIAFALLVIVAAFAAARDWRDREVTQPPGDAGHAEPLQRDVTAAPIRVHDYTLTPRARFRLTARVLRANATASRWRPTSCRATLRWAGA